MRFARPSGHEFPVIDGPWFRKLVAQTMAITFTMDEMVSTTSLDRIIEVLGRKQATSVSS
jgi:hypothetical protein